MRLELRKQLTDNDFGLRTLSEKFEISPIRGALRLKAS
jgi:hypothetical protein